MRTLVTGCAGFIGSHLTESLLADGHAVVGIDCFNDNYGRPQKLRNIERAREWAAFDFVPVDLARGNLEDLVEECETIFHLAAEPGVRSSWGSRFAAYVRNNVEGTHHLLEAIRAHPERRVVYASSSSVYGQAETFPTPEDALPAPYSPYGVTKLAAEHLCGAYHRNFGVDVVTLRYFSVYGPRQRPDMAFNVFLRRAAARQHVRLYGGDQSRDFTFVGDVVDATRAAADRRGVGGRILNVGGGSRISLTEIVGLIGEITERPLGVERVGAQHGDVRDTAADIRAAADAIGYRPAVGIEDGLRAEWEWLTRTLERETAVVASTP